MDTQTPVTARDVMRYLQENFDSATPEEAESRLQSLTYDSSTEHCVLSCIAMAYDPLVASRHGPDPGTIGQGSETFDVDMDHIWWVELQQIAANKVPDVTAEAMMEDFATELDVESFALVSRILNRELSPTLSSELVERVRPGIVSRMDHHPIESFDPAKMVFPAVIEPLQPGVVLNLVSSPGDVRFVQPSNGQRVDALQPVADKVLAANNESVRYYRIVAEGKFEQMARDDDFRRKTCRDIDLPEDTPLEQLKATLLEGAALERSLTEYILVVSAFEIGGEIDSVAALESMEDIVDVRLQILDCVDVNEAFSRFPHSSKSLGERLQAMIDHVERLDQHMGPENFNKHFWLDKSGDLVMPVENVNELAAGANQVRSLTSGAPLLVRPIYGHYWLSGETVPVGQRWMRIPPDFEFGLSLMTPDKPSVLH